MFFAAGDEKLPVDCLRSVNISRESTPGKHRFTIRKRARIGGSGEEKERRLALALVLPSVK